MNFLDKVSKNTQVSNLMKICPVGAELFHVDRRTDGRTDRTKLLVAFCNFANGPNKIGKFFTNAIGASGDFFSTK